MYTADLQEKELIAKFLEQKTENTIRTYHKEIENFKFWLGENYPDLSLSKVTSDVAKDYFKYLLEKKSLKKATKIRIHRTFLSLYKFGFEQEVFSSNPFFAVKMEKQDFGYMQGQRTLGLDELQKLLILTKNSSKRDYAMILLFITSRFTALEITNLCWNDLKCDILNNWGAYVLTKGSREGREKRRLIPLRTDAVHALEDYKTECIEMFVRIEKDFNPGSRVFLNRYGEPITETGIRKNISRICEEAGIKKISPKDLTHLSSALSRFYGATDEQIKDQSGFSSTLLVEKYKYVLDILNDSACKVIKLPEH